MDFVEFKRRILRLAESLLAARPDDRGPWDSRLLGDEQVDVQLGADAVLIADPDPLRLALFNTRRDAAGLVSRYTRGVVRLEVSAPTPGSFAADGAAPGATVRADEPAHSAGDEWLREHRSAFEDLDCRMIGSAAGIPVVVLPVGAILTKWYGESEQRLRRILALARRAAPMLLLIDELDAIGRRRSGLDETSSRLVSILLAELDGLEDRGRIAVVTAVNDPEVLDSALLDRFDVHITYPEPDSAGRASVLAYYARHLEPGDVEQLAGRMDGWSYRRIADYGANVVRRFAAGLDLSRPETSDLPLPSLSDYLTAVDD